LEWTSSRYCKTNGAKQNSPQLWKGAVSQG
jgi:hypothetical protein